MSSPHRVPPADLAGVPDRASLLRRLGALVVEYGVIAVLYSLLMLALADLIGPRDLGQDPIPLLILAAVRVIGETTWGASPGKYLTDLQVVFRTRTGGRVSGWRRLPQSVLRNIWLWLPAVMTLIDSSFTWYNGLATAVALTALIRRDNRSVADLLAGAEVLSTKRTVPAPAPREAPWPTSFPPQRALAWAIDLAVAAVIGAALTQVTAWSFWLDTLTVLGLIRVVTEWVGLPSPGKAALGLRVYYLPWFDLRAMVFVQVLVRNLWVTAAIFYAASAHATPLLVEGLIMVSIIVFPGHRGVTDWLARAHVTEVRDGQAM